MKYDKDTDYRKLIDAAASRGDYENAARYELARNAKIDGEGMSYGKTNDYAKYLPFESGVDYAERAGKLAAAGDFGGAYDALYGNDTEVFNEKYREVAARWRRDNRPKRAGAWDVM